MQVVVLLSYLGYLAAAGAILPGKLIAGAVLPDSSRLHYRCNGTAAKLALPHDPTLFSAFYLAA